MNMMNKSVVHRGRPANNDANNKHGPEALLDSPYETAVQRGVYSAAAWFKAKQYGSICPTNRGVQAHSDLRASVAGAGVKVGPPVKNKSSLTFV